MIKSKSNPCLTLPKIKPTTCKLKSNLKLIFLINQSLQKFTLIIFKSKKLPKSIKTIKSKSSLFSIRQKIENHLNSIIKTIFKFWFIGLQIAFRRNFGKVLWKRFIFEEYFSEMFWFLRFLWKFFFIWS